jgi:hypothetical protein
MLINVVGHDPDMRMTQQRFAERQEFGMGGDGSVGLLG